MITFEDTLARARQKTAADDLVKKQAQERSQAFLEDEARERLHDEEQIQTEFDAYFLDLFGKVRDQYFDGDAEISSSCKVVSDGFEYSVRLGFGEVEGEYGSRDRSFQYNIIIVGKLDGNQSIIKKKTFLVSNNGGLSTSKERKALLTGYRIEDVPDKLVSLENSNWQDLVEKDVLEILGGFPQDMRWFADFKVFRQLAGFDK